MKQETLTPQEMELISQYAELSDDPNLLAEKLCEVIKIELGFNRSADQLKNLLLTTQNKHQD